MNALNLLNRGGETVSVDGPEIARLRERLTGNVVLARDPGYGAARAVWNGMVDKHPAMIAYCRDREDVQRMLGFARSRDLAVAVRAGGHNAAGNCVCDGGLVIDVSGLKGAAVDTAQRRIQAGAGLTLGEFDAATQAHGLATPMGVNSDTGMAGLTLGGGIGRLARRHGLACDNLVRAEVVTADGRCLTASETENPDLFWGLRGGGGNFGIVTRFEFALHRLGPSVLGGSLLYTGGKVVDALRAYAEFARQAPDELAADAALVRGPDGRAAFSVSLCYAGGMRAGRQAIEPLRRRMEPDGDTLGPVDYVSLQSAGDALFVRGRRYYWKAHLLDRVNEGAIEALTQGFAQAPSPLSIIVLQHLGGAIARVPTNATAYAHRRAGHDCFALSIWEDASTDEANIQWARNVWQSLIPFSSGAVYVNNLGDEGDERMRAAYGPNYARLQAIKARYDPDNFFRGNQNVRPAGALTPPA